MRDCRRSIITAFLILSLGQIGDATPEDTKVKPLDVVNKVAQKCASAKQYIFEGDLDVARKSGERRMNVLAKAKVKLAIAPRGKFLLRVENARSAYLIVSDGQKSWSYVPALNRYTERDAAAASEGMNEGLDDPRLLPEMEIINRYSRLVIPALSRVTATAENAFMNGSAAVRYEGGDQGWPVFAVLSSKQGQNLMYLTMDPNTLSIGRMAWTRPVSAPGKVLVRLQVYFSSLRIGEPIVDSEFTFSPPKNAIRVAALRIPGESGSSLLNTPAPEFDGRTPDSNPIRRGDLKGRPVLLSFGANWCEPCRRQTAVLSKLQGVYEDKGLSTIVINTDEDDASRDPPKEVSSKVPTVEDGGGTMQQRYQVRWLPTLFLINRKGIIVRVFFGMRDEKALQTALKTSGL